MSATALWLMVAGMGAYQGLNPSMGWLYAVSRALEEGSTEAALSGTAALAAGHYVAMVAVLLPTALLFALTPAHPMAVQPWLGVGLIGFGIFKFFYPSHPRFLVRIRPDRPVRWSFAMALTHCGSPMMMLAPLTSLLMLFELDGLARPMGERLGWFSVAAFAVPAGMAAVLLLTALIVAVVVYRRFGLRALTRYWVNLDLGWAFVFMAMGVMALLMSMPGGMPKHMS